MHLVACKLKNVPLTVQFCAQTTWPSGSTVWLGGKFRLMEKDALAPVRVGPSFFKSNVTWPPSNRDNTQFHSFQTDKVSMFVFFNCIAIGRGVMRKQADGNKKKKKNLTRPTVSESWVSVFPHWIQPCIPWAVPCELTFGICKNE